MAMLAVGWKVFVCTATEALNKMEADAYKYQQRRTAYITSSIHPCFLHSRACTTQAMAARDNNHINLLSQFQGLTLDIALVQGHHTDISPHPLQAPILSFGSGFRA